jgi:uncharacterized protein YdbL (DUF1318 family)
MPHFRLTILITLLLSTSLTGFAANLGQVKADMKERLPRLEALWQAAKIGENNEGYIEARTDLSLDEKQLVEAENSDRKVVYQAIARSTESTPKQVGVQRAAQISNRAAKGLWLQDASGRWYRK